jgi:hypothetical protein
VCEIGFADYGSDNYQLVLFDDGDVDENGVSLFKKTTFAALLDANIKSEVVEVSGKEHEFLKYYSSFKKVGLPLSILISPEGEATPFNLSKDKAEFRESVWRLLEDVTSSAIRIQSLNKIVQSYAVVLFIEGDNSSENEKALQEISSTIETIASTQKKMPKPFENPPVLIRLPKEQINNEKVLLWSLGWREEFTGKPVTAVLYGRGRLMGQLLSGELLQKSYLNNLLSLVGADCECGLDRSWILGRMMPLRWNNRRQKEVVKWRDFDAENPLVKAEMSQILSISPSKTRKQGAAGTTTLYGYTESEMKIVESYDSQQKNEEESQPEDEIKSKYGLIILSSITLLVLIVGILIIVRKRR